MAWARLDDSFHDHPKVAALPHGKDGLAAVGLFTLSLTWAHKVRRSAVEPGLVPWGQLQRFAGRDHKRLARVLLDARLYDADDTDRGCWLHDFEDYGPDQRKAAAGRKGAASRWQANGSGMADGMAGG